MMSAPREPDRPPSSAGDGQAVAGAAMEVYEVGSRRNLVVGVVVSTAVGAIVLLGCVLLPLALAVRDGADSLSLMVCIPSVGAILLGATACRLAWRAALRVPYRLRVWDDGKVEIVGLRAAVTLQAHDIVSIVKKGPRTAGLDADPQRMRIVHAGGCVTVPYFARADELIARLVALNPGIAVGGAWRR
jgi:hypothetical protein